MQTLGKRVSIRREQLGLTQKSLAQKIGISQQSINKIETEQTRNPRNLDKLARALNVSQQWLLFGDTGLHPQNQEIKDSALQALEWELMEHNQDEFIELPVLDIEIAAGSGSYNGQEQEIFKLPFRRYTLRKIGVNARNAKIVRVIGNSMSPLLRSGDVVGIDTANRHPIIDGDLYAIRDGNLVRVKQLVARSDGGIIIKSFNDTDYPDEILTQNEFSERINIIGRVFWSSTLW